MYRYNRKREIIKNVIYITVILLIAVVSTYYIYNKFQVDRDIDFNSESLDVTYHENSGDKVSIVKVTPVTDSVGLSSKSYNITIKNNLTENVSYKIKLIDDLEEISNDLCSDNLISKDNIRVSIKVNKKDNKIYTLDELEDNLLLSSTIKALDSIDISIRAWVRQDSSLPLGSNMHYHGIIQVIEDDSDVAINK
jgi:hypothetical protein